MISSLPFFLTVRCHFTIFQLKKKYVSLEVKRISVEITLLLALIMPLGTLFHLFNFTLFIWEMGVIIIPTGYTAVVRMKQDYIRQVSNVTPGA